MEYTYIDLEVRKAIIHRNREPSRVIGSAELASDLNFIENEILSLFRELDKKFGVTTMAKKIASCDTVKKISDHYYNEKNHGG